MSPSAPHAPDDPSDSIRVEHEFDAETPPSIAIVQAIAALEDVDPLEFSSDLGIRLYDHVDPGALDDIVAETRDGASVTVELTLHDGDRYAVRIRDTGHLVVRRSV